MVKQKDLAQTEPFNGNTKVTKRFSHVSKWCKTKIMNKIKLRTNHG